MSLSIKERNELIRQGKHAALNRNGAFTCPHIGNDARFEAWIKGYQLGEKKLAATENVLVATAAPATF